MRLRLWWFMILRAGGRLQTDEGICPEKGMGCLIRQDFIGFGSLLESCYQGTALPIRMLGHNLGALIERERLNKLNSPNLGTWNGTRIG